MLRIICYLLRVKESLQNRSDEDTRSQSSEENGVDEDSNADSDDPDGDSDEEEDRAVKPTDVFRDARRLFPWHGELRALVIELRETIEKSYDEETQMQALLKIY